MKTIDDVFREYEEATALLEYQRLLKRWSDQNKPKKQVEIMTIKGPKKLILKDMEGDFYLTETGGDIVDKNGRLVSLETEANVRQALRNQAEFEEHSKKTNLRFEPHPPYPGFPDAECPRCGASKQSPHRRWPQCNLCNPYIP